jgi:flagellar hook-basal body complex protein FliE
VSSSEQSATEAVAAVERAVDSARLQAQQLSALASASNGAQRTTFAAALTDGVDRVGAALAKADAAIVQASIDGSQPPHQVMLAIEEARLSFQFALQVRNRLIEGYQELMRMQV